MSPKILLTPIFSLIFIFSLYCPSAEADTIVHLERQRYNNPEYNKRHEHNNSAQDEKPISASDSKANEKDATQQELQSINDGEEITVNEKNVDYDQKHENEKVSLNNEITKKDIIKRNKYFHDFTLHGPELTFNHGEGGDLAKTSSIIFYGVKYSLNSDSEVISINLTRSRMATAFGSDTYSYLFVNYNLKFSPHASKKRLPKIEIITEKGIKTVEFEKISDFRSDGFSIRTGNDSFLERFYYPGCDANLLLENKNGEVLRVPLPAEVIEQWHHVGKADLRKIKREYEEE